MFTKDQVIYELLKSFDKALVTIQELGCAPETTQENAAKAKTTLGEIQAELMVLKMMYLLACKAESKPTPKPSLMSRIDKWLEGILNKPPVAEPIPPAEKAYPDDKGATMGRGQY